MSSFEEVGAKWDEIKIIVESLESDMDKCKKGNKAAGVRARRGLRLLREESKNLGKMTLEANKSAD